MSTLQLLQIVLHMSTLLFLQILCHKSTFANLQVRAKIRTIRMCPSFRTQKFPIEVEVSLVSPFPPKFSRASEEPPCTCNILPLLLLRSRPRALNRYILDLTRGILMTSHDLGQSAELCHRCQKGKLLRKWGKRTAKKNCAVYEEVFDGGKGVFRGAEASIVLKNTI